MLQVSPDRTSGGAGLGSYEELARIGPCSCRPEGLRLRSEHGELVHPRGGCVNHCERCAMFKGYEDLEMLVLDSLEGDAPSVLVVTNTRTATLDMATFRTARTRMLEAVRRRFPGVEYACKVEYTTGYGPRSGGQRRPHWNWLIKGVRQEDVDELRELVRRVWCRHVDARPEQQYCEPLRSPVAALKYIVEHFSKASQRPPRGFKGQRFNVSRGYFAGTVQAQRARAKEVQARKRELWKAEQRGEAPHEAELSAELALRVQAATRWTLCTASGARLSPEYVGAELTERLRNARPHGRRRTEGRDEDGAGGAARPVLPPAPRPRALADAPAPGASP